MRWRSTREQRALRANRPQSFRHATKPAHPAVGTALVEHDHARHRRMVGQQRGIRRCGHHIHKALTSQPLEERGGEDHVAEEARLEDGGDNCH
jgi:hypothetical protein